MPRNIGFIASILILTGCGGPVCFSDMGTELWGSDNCVELSAVEEMAIQKLPLHFYITERYIRAYLPKRVIVMGNRDTFNHYGQELRGVATKDSFEILLANDRFFTNEWVHEALHVLDNGSSTPKNNHISWNGPDFGPVNGNGYGNAIADMTGILGILFTSDQQ